MNKEEQDKIYKQLRLKYSDEEIAESFIFSADLTNEERIALSEKLKNKRDNMTIAEKEMYANLIKKVMNDE